MGLSTLSTLLHLSPTIGYKQDRSKSSKEDERAVKQKFKVDDDSTMAISASKVEPVVAAQ